MIFENNVFRMETFFQRKILYFMFMDFFYIRSKKIAAFNKSNLTLFIVLQDEQKKMLSLFIVRIY